VRRTSLPDVQVCVFVCDMSNSLIEVSVGGGWQVRVTNQQRHPTEARYIIL